MLHNKKKADGKGLLRLWTLVVVFAMLFSLLISFANAQETDEEGNGSTAAEETVTEETVPDENEAYEEETEVSLKSALRGKTPKTVSVMIGPEGGFDESEIRMAKEAGIQSVTLGKRILRTETAPLTVASVVLYELGEME